MAKSEDSVQDVLKTALKKYGLRAGSLADVVEPVKAITTGNLGIDTAIGVGGLPLARSTELYGEPSSGKTTTALQTAAELQRVIKAGGDKSRGIGDTDHLLYCDYEQALDVEYAAALGLDVEHPSFIFTQPDSLEAGSNFAIDLIKTGLVRMTIWDSVAAMTPETALENDVGKYAIAEQARLMSQFMKKLNPLLAEQNCAAIFLNHLAVEINLGGYSRVQRNTTPGGRALKYYASLRLEYQKIGNVKGKLIDDLTQEEVEGTIATNVKVKVVKNKLAAPFRTTVVRVRYGKGFDNFWTAMQVLVARKYIPSSAGYFYFDKTPELIHKEMSKGTTASQRPYIKGEQNLFTFADSHPLWRSAVIAYAAKIVGGKSVAEELVVEETPDVEDAVEDLVAGEIFEEDDVEDLTPDTMSDDFVTSSLLD